MIELLWSVCITGKPVTRCRECKTALECQKDAYCQKCWDRYQKTGMLMNSTPAGKWVKL